MDDPHDRDEEDGVNPLQALALRLRRIARRIAHGLPVHWGKLEGKTAVPASAQGPLAAAFGRYGRAYFQRWLLIGAMIGVVAGIGAIVFASAIALCTRLFLGGVAGFFPPAPAGEGMTMITPIGRRWLIPLVTTLGGLLTGFIVFTLAPEAEGHGTDAAIKAFHEKGGRIRSRIPLVKLVASAITIGSGGSAGREGPTAQISAGFGSWLGDLLHLDDHDRRIAVAAGIGSGIGAIFKAPFGGALLSAEILYKRDFEADALFPSFIASVIGFTLYGAWAGWTPIFGTGGHFSFTHASSLLGYFILGICAGLIGLLYPKTLYGVRDLFKRIHIPNHFKPAIGGLLVGIIGLFIPQALGMGYGYVQFGINGDFFHIAAWLMAALVFVKILTTSLTIGSGGSGGVFGPGMVIGGFLGSALWAGMHAIAPGLVAGTNAGAFAVVGMGAFFGGIAKAPLAVILMVAEMTGEYSLIAPAMLATMVAYLITGETSIYSEQVPTRLDSPAHKNDYALPLLQSLTVQDALTVGLTGALATATPDTSVNALSKVFRERRAASVLILNGTRLVGVVTPTDLARVEPARMDVTLARQVMSRALVRGYTDESLYAVWLRMSRRNLRQLPVVERAEPARLVGVVTTDAIARLLRLPSGKQSVGRMPMPSAAGVAANGSARADLSPPEIPAIATASEDAAEGETGAKVETGTAMAAGTLAEAANDGARRATIPASVIARESGDPFAMLRVRDAMLRTPRTIGESEPLANACRLLDDRGRSLLVVDEQGRLTGIITRSDINQREEQERTKTLTVGDVAVRNLVTARPKETLRVAVHRMNRLGLRQLPVVGSEQPGPPLGLLRREDILAAYEQVAGAATASPPGAAGSAPTADGR
ncbi:MAG TPA: chloride channel protein [Ktedonobacterales bacterium]|nr:chloride channel protein [Ktedonobacterales bacterium]